MFLLKSISLTNSCVWCGKVKVCLPLSACPLLLSPPSFPSWLTFASKTFLFFRIWPPFHQKNISPSVVIWSHLTISSNWAVALSGGSCLSLCLDSDRVNTLLYLSSCMCMCVCVCVRPVLQNEVGVSLWNKPKNVTKDEEEHTHVQVDEGSALFMCVWV